MIFRSLVKFKVTITLGASQRHRRVLAIARPATFLDSVVSLTVRSQRLPHRLQVQDLCSPTLFTLVRTLPAMRQLRTIRLSSIFLPETYLRCIISSQHLIHLTILDIRMPKLSKFPPLEPKLRTLILKWMDSWDTVRPLLVHLAASLEYLEFHSCRFEFEPRSLPRLPSFPRLRELRHQRRYDGNGTLLDEVFHVSQVTHLHLYGTLNSSHITTFPKSLQHLSTEDGMLSQRMLGTTPMAQLKSLSIRLSEERGTSHHLETSAFICDHFPGITSLRLNITWSLRNAALVMARSQHNVRAIALSIPPNGVLDSEEGWRLNRVKSLNDYPQNNMLPGVLQSLRVDVVQSRGNLEWSLVQCSQWIDDDIIHPMTGLGGPDLGSIDLSLRIRKSGLEPERRIWKRWVKLLDGDWRIEGAL